MHLDTKSLNMNPCNVAFWRIVTRLLQQPVNYISKMIIKNSTSHYPFKTTKARCVGIGNPWDAVTGWNALRCFPQQDKHKADN